MTERPILFSGAMVRAILAGTKTQTRRVVTPTPRLMPEWSSPGSDGWIFFEGSSKEILIAEDYIRRCHGEWAARCPYGKPGDTLWVRETWYCDHCFAGDYETTWRKGVRANLDKLIDREACEREWRGDDFGMMYYRADVPSGRFGDAGYWAEPGSKWRPSIHMPRWASRLTLRVTDVRVKRVQDINEADARAEGVRARDAHIVVQSCGDGGCRIDDSLSNTARGAFAALWDSINAKRGFGWDSNPWVWVVSFERLAGGE